MLTNVAYELARTFRSNSNRNNAATSNAATPRERIVVAQRELLSCATEQSSRTRMGKGIRGAKKVQGARKALSGPEGASRRGVQSGYVGRQSAKQKGYFGRSMQAEPRCDRFRLAF